MAINVIPLVEVSGFEYQIYSLDFTFGGAQNPSSVEVQFVNESGVYEKPVLTTKVATSISFPGFKFIGYPISWEINKTSNGSLMKVVFTDTSIILDKYNVGLYKRHSQTKLTSIPYLIILGDEKNPCRDESGNSVREKLDPCNPCSKYVDFVKNYIDCEEEAQINIADIVYTLQDLLDKLPVNYKDAPISNSDFFVSYTGTLREVLQQISTDYGYTFYWNGSEIVFVNLREDRSINDQGINQNQILASSESESLEGSISRSAMAYFGINGRVIPYQCEDDLSRQIVCHPITLTDIIPSYAPIMDGYKNHERLQACCVMSKYSSDIRDNYVWFIKEKITDGKVCENAIGKTIKLMGNMKITGVASSKSDGMERMVYGRLLANLGSTTEKADLIKRGIYFFKAKWSEEIYNKYLKLEKDLGDNFLGKYYIRMFDVTLNRAGANFQTMDGDARYYTRGVSGIQLPFADILPENIKYGNDFIKNLIDKNGNSNNNFILVTRSGSWIPQQNQSPMMMNLISECGKYAPKVLGKDNVGNWLKADEVIFMAFEYPKGFTISGFSQDRNREEEKLLNLSIKVDGKKAGCGLRSSVCDKISINFPNVGLGTIYMPANSGNGSNHGYTVVYENKETEKHNVLQPKMELIRERIAQGDTLKYEINYKNISDPVLNYLSNESGSTCLFSKSKITEAMDKYLMNMDYRKSSKLIKKQYTLCGFPNQEFTIEDGLESLSVRVGDDGVETYITFGNSLSQPLNLDMVNRIYEKLLGDLNKLKEPLRKLVPKASNLIVEI